MEGAEEAEEDGERLTIVDDVSDMGTKRPLGSGMYADKERVGVPRRGRRAAAADGAVPPAIREQRGGGGGQRLYDSHDIDAAAAQIVSSDSVEALLAFGNSLAKPAEPTAVTAGTASTVAAASARWV